MRYRKLDAKNDYQLGHGPADYHVDTPECVTQAVKTRLALLAAALELEQTAPTDD